MPHSKISQSNETIWMSKTILIQVEFMWKCCEFRDVANERVDNWTHDNCKLISFWFSNFSYTLKETEKTILSMLEYRVQAFFSLLLLADDLWATECQNKLLEFTWAYMLYEIGNVEVVCSTFFLPHEHHILHFDIRNWNESKKKHTHSYAVKTYPFILLNMVHRP